MKKLLKDCKNYYQNLNAVAFWVLAVSLICACFLLLAAVILPWTPLMAQNPSHILAVSETLAGSGGGCIAVGIVLCVLFDVIAKYDGLEEPQESKKKKK